MFSVRPAVLPFRPPNGTRSPGRSPRPVSPRSAATLGRLRLLALLLPCVYGLLGGFGSRNACADSVKVDSVQQVVARWQPGTLFVDGDVGMSRAALDRLAEWIESYPNWTVVLIERAEGQQYVDADGRTHYHTDAVETLLGHELFGRTEFSALVDARTGLANGAILYISLDPVARYRRVGYYASEAFDQRGLGESAWSGKLDRLAINPLRDGRRIADAVKNTIRTIESRLTAQLEEEERARIGMIERARLAIEDAELQLENTLEDAGEKARQHPEVGLFDLDPSSPQTALSRARRAYDRGQFQDAEEYASEVDVWVRRNTRAMDQFFESGARLDELDRAIAGAEADGHAVGGAKSSLAKLRSDWSRGRMPRTADLQELHTEIRALTEFPAWLDRLRKRWENLRAQPEGEHRPTVIGIGERLDQLGAALERGEAFPAGRLQAIERDLARVSRAIAREQSAKVQERWTLVVVMVLVALAVALSLFFAARRIRFVRRRARTLFDQWDKLLTEKTVSLWELETRKDALLGSAQEPRYTGETHELAGIARSRIAELFLIRSVARKHHDSVRELVEPDGFLERLNHLVLGHRHRRAIEQLTTALIVFDRETELREVLEEERSTPQVHILAADLESAQPFRSSFDELMMSFNLKAEEALFSLSSIERATQEVYDAIGRTDALEKRLRELARAFEDRARRHPERGLAELSAMIERAIVPIRADVDRSAERDPVRSVRLARELFDRSTTLLELLETVHGAVSETIPKFDRRVDDFGLPGSSILEPSRKEAGAHESIPAIAVGAVWVDWIEAAWRGLIRGVDGWLATVRATDGRLEADPAPPFADKFAALEARVARARSLDGARRVEVPQRIFDAQFAVESLRSRIESELGVPRDRVLEEGDPTPDRWIEKARQLHAKAGPALAEGELDRAEHDLRLGVTFADRVVDVVTRTREALDGHTARVAALRQRIADASDAIPEHDAILRELERDFDAEVLRFDREEFDYPGSNETIADNIDEVSRTLAEAPLAVDQAVAAHHDGGILNSVARLDRIDGLLDRVDFRFREIVERRQQVDSTVESNQARRAKLEGETRSERGRLEDRRTRASTRTRLERINSLAASATELEQRRPGVPFQARDAIDEWETQLEQLRRAIDHDWQLFAEASRSLKSAQERLDELRREAEWVMTDGVPDNATIRNACRRGVEELPEQLDPVVEGMAGFHEDWRHLDSRAEAIGNEATRLLATLRKEAELGRAALAAVERAHGAVRLMQAWTSPFGVWISGDPGAGRYRRARAALEAGNYDRAWELAEQARRAADDAVEDAKRRARRRKLAAARRRAQAAASRTSIFSSISSGGSSSSGIFGGGGGGFSSSGFSSGGSGFSSSSSGSSGSGFSSSSW